MKPYASLKYLIGGNPAGATRFTACYLTYCGLLTSHEGFYVKDGELLRNSTGQIGSKRLRLLQEYDYPEAECSYTVGEWMDNSQVSELPVICLLRHPVDTLNSLIRMDVAYGGQKPIASILSEMLSRWNKLLSHPRLWFVCCVEEDLPVLVSKLGLVQRDQVVIERYLHNEGRCRFSKGDFASLPGFSQMQLLMDRFGYG